MKIARVLELLKIERECVTRQSPCNEKSKLCDRNCGECDIAQNDLELIDMYDFVIGIIEALNPLKEEKPVKPVVNVDEWVCGNCGLSVEQQRMIHPGAIFHDFFEYCPHCGKKVDWEAVNQDG